MSHILVFGEKPSVNKRIASSMAEAFPGQRIIYLSVVPYRTPQMVFPRGLKRSNYPYIGEPAYSLRHLLQIEPMERTESGEIVAVTDLTEHQIKHDFSAIVSAMDPDHTGAVSFYLVAKQLYGEGIFSDPRLSALKLFDLSKNSVDRAIQERAPFLPLFTKEVSYGLVKRYFDWNWNTNSLVAIGEVLREAGIKTDAMDASVTKYSLLMLHALRDHLPTMDAQLLKSMDQWKGSGKYPPINIGSIASRSQILWNLVVAGLLATETEGTRRYYSVSKTGYEVLDLLHRDTFDPDLPSRLHQWCEDGLETAKPKIDRYIRTLFGKQMAFFDSRERRTRKDLQRLQAL